jgi:hypothetical protein
MATPLPPEGQEDRSVPHGDEAMLIVRALASASRPTTGLTGLQSALLTSIVHAMLGLDVNVHALDPVEADEFAAALARRNRMFRTRLVQHMELLNMVLQPPDGAAARRVEVFAEELCVGEECVHKLRSLAEGSLRLAAQDFDRSRYLSRLEIDGRLDALHLPSLDPDAAYVAWTEPVVDDDFSSRWRSLARLPASTIGRQVHDFYLSRGFAFPGEPGSAPPLLAQHDWVHVLADYGTTVEAELEVFAYIARASDNPDAFALLAMVVNLFETGAVMGGAGIFDAAPGHLSRPGMPVRVADALRRGALTPGDIDFLAFDWSALADRDLEDLRRDLRVPPKSPEAIAAGSVGPWHPAGMSDAQRIAAANATVRTGAPRSGGRTRHERPRP